MRVYNNKTSSLDLPLYGGIRLAIPAKSVSKDFLGNTEFLSTVISNYDADEVAFIVAGPSELQLCAAIPTCSRYVVQTLEEALDRFAPKVEVKEEVKVEEESVVEETPKAETVAEEKPKRVVRKKKAAAKEDDSANA